MGNQRTCLFQNQKVSSDAHPSCAFVPRIFSSVPQAKPCRFQSTHTVSFLPGLQATLSRARYPATMPKGDISSLDSASNDNQSCSVSRLLFQTLISDFLP